MNWGPPSLTFSSGISPLSDAQPFINRNQTSAVGDPCSGTRPAQRHLRRRFPAAAIQSLSQQDPRGAFTFTGAAAGGSDFADFLLGIPDTSSIAFGNADKYFRASSYDAYVTDDWRISPD